MEGAHVAKNDQDLAKNYAGGTAELAELRARRAERQKQPRIAVAPMFVPGPEQPPPEIELEPERVEVIEPQKAPITRASVVAAINSSLEDVRDAIRAHKTGMDLADMMQVLNEFAERPSTQKKIWDLACKWRELDALGRIDLVDGHVLKAEIESLWPVRVGVADGVAVAVDYRKVEPQELPILIEPEPKAAAISSGQVPTTQHAETPAWRPKAPKRTQGYNRPLFELVLKAYNAGNQRPPSPLDVIAAFKESQPPEIARVNDAGFDYFADGRKDGDVPASIGAIRQTIKRMVSYK
jgi:hypothetical protein